VALSNAPEEKSTSAGGKKTVVFEESDLMSTYLFSFVAGKFQTLSHEQNGRSMTMYHREPDSEKVVSNATEIFKLHHEAMDWMEDYTGIKYPFKKFDFVLLPAYQYGGMEHVGAVQYRASRLMLDESASLDDKISRSMLIAHETAHMWFGNLVTMEWFDDVWLKEVFANFMASKITEPNFPEVNHSLNFLFSHYPQAYAVDRTEGANAIRQPLDNLKNAGSMYGAIIYHKAPIVMRQLESLMGDYAFRDALREYLDNFKNKNATWDDLVTIFDLKTELDIKQWSNVWVTQPGMPFIDIEFETGDEASEYDVVQYDLSGEGKVWPQKFDITFAYPDGDIFYPVYAENVHFIIKKNLGTAMPEHILLNSNGMGYGIFAYGLEYIKDDFIFNLAKVDIPSISDDLQRGVSYLVLHEYLLHEGMNPRKYMRFLEEYIFVEDNELILTYLLNNLELIYWKFLTPEQNKQYAAEVESLLIQKLGRVSDPKVKHLIFKKYVSMAQTETGVQNLMRFWSMQDTPKGITLTEEEYILLAYHIELKANQKTEVIPDMIARLENPDKKAEVTFVAQAIAGDVAAREKFFASLLSPENRSHESWVNKALYYLHHPLRAQTSIDLLEDGLEELEEIQRTGDIFFPKRWLDNTLWGYNSPEAIEIINDYLASSGGMDEKLKQKVLQAADMVFRAERDISQYGTVEE
jgi:aminopeptidase N